MAKEQNPPPRPRSKEAARRMQPNQEMNTGISQHVLAASPPSCSGHARVSPRFLRHGPSMVRVSLGNKQMNSKPRDRAHECYKTLDSGIDSGYEVKGYADLCDRMDMDMHRIADSGKICNDETKVQPLHKPTSRYVLTRDPASGELPVTKVNRSKPPPVIILEDQLRLTCKAFQPDIVPVSCSDGTGHLYIPMVQPFDVPVSGSHVVGVRCTSKGEIVSVFKKSAAGEYFLSKAKSRRQREFKLSPPKPGENDRSMGHQINGPQSCPPGPPPKPLENGRHQSNGPASCPQGSPPKPRENGCHQRNGRVSSPPGSPSQPPMGQPSNGPVHVFGSQYTSKDPVNLIFKKSAAGGYSVSTAAESSVPWKFQTSPCDTKLHRRIELVELGENRPRIAMLKAQNMTAHGRWDVRSCDGERKRRVCSIRRGRDGTDVLAALENSSSYACDFKFTGNLLDRNCTIFKGDSSRIIAQMYPMENTDNFMVEVYPNVDSAFVVSFIAIVAVINNPGKVKDIAGNAASLSLSGLAITGVALGQNVIG